MDRPRETIASFAQATDSPSKSIPVDEAEELPTVEELQLERARDATDFLKHRFAMQVQRDATRLARDTFYTQEIREAQQLNSALRAELVLSHQEMAKESTQAGLAANWATPQRSFFPREHDATQSRRGGPDGSSTTELAR
jgi:hypothetical protein